MQFPGSPKQSEIKQFNFDNGKTLSYVRMEPSSRIVRGKNSAEIQLAAILFYDCRNSQPRGVVFKVDDIITFFGEKYQVATVESLYGRKDLHHYEVGLIKYA